MLLQAFAGGACQLPKLPFIFLSALRTLLLCSLMYVAVKCVDSMRFLVWSVWFMTFCEGHYLLLVIMVYPMNRSWSILCWNVRGINTAEK